MASQPPNIMGSDSIRSLGPFQKNYNFSVILPDIGGFNGITVGMLAQQVNVGDYTIGQIDLKIGSLQGWFAGLMSTPQFRIDFLVDSSNMLSNYFAAWKLLIVDANGLYFPKSNYSKSIFVRCLNVDESVSSQLECVGSWPYQYAFYQFSSRENSITKTPIVFKFDKLNFTDYSL